jgi:predicted nucleic acid-binding protein
MNVVDSSGWLEYFSDGPNSSFFAPIIQDTGRLFVPVISIYEVFKRVFEQKGEDIALQAVALMHQGTVLDIDGALALYAAKLSAQLKLPMADSFMLSAARLNKAVLWTQDSDFKGLEGVRFIAKKKK